MAKTSMGKQSECSTSKCFSPTLFKVNKRPYTIL